MSTVAGVPIMIEEQQKPAALQANAAVKSFGRGRGRHQVLFDVNVEVWPGECLGIIGASGSGKSTLTRIMFGLEQPDSGDVLFNGVSILGASGRAQLRSLRAASGIVYQNPFASLDPRWTAGRSIAEPLRLAGNATSAVLGARCREPWN